MHGTTVLVASLCHNTAEKIYLCKYHQKKIKQIPRTYIKYYGLKIRHIRYTAISKHTQNLLLSVNVQMTQIGKIQHEMLLEMNGTLLQFSLNSHHSLGKRISLMTIYRGSNYMKM